MDSYPEFIPGAGACIVSKNVLSGAGQARWMVRDPSLGPGDTGWRIFSHIDTTEYLSDSNNMTVADFNQVCALEPALIVIWDMPVGSDLQLVLDDRGRHIYDTPTGREIPREEYYYPPHWRD